MASVLGSGRLSTFSERVAGELCCTIKAVLLHPLGEDRVLRGPWVLGVSVGRASPVKSSLSLHVRLEAEVPSRLFCWFTLMLRI